MLFQGGLLKNATHTSHGYPVKFNRSNDDFELAEVFTRKVCLMQQMMSQQTVDVMSEAETSINITMASVSALQFNTQIDQKFFSKRCVGLLVCKSVH